MIRIAYSPVYKYSLPPGHRFPMEKYELLPEQLLYEGTVREDQFFHPVKMTREEVMWTHTEAYISDLFNNRLPRKSARKIGFPIQPSLIERGLHIARGTVDCALFAIQHGVALNIAGGTHHAYADHGEGFCVYNDFAIAANWLLHHQKVSRILIVDLDVHQGNGTAHIFRSDPRVFTFSMHGAKNYPLRKEKSDLDIALPDRTEDEFYLTTLQNKLPELIEKVQPDLVFYLAGADVIATDALGRLSLSKQGAKRRDYFVLKTCKENMIPVAVSMGGGYSPLLRDVVDTHANTFRVAMDLYG